jgi:hypothetical protein
MKSIMQKHILNLLLTFLIFFVVGCSSTQSISFHVDNKYFKESPLIVHTESRFFLKFVYSDSENASGFAMYTESNIENDSLIFYLPVTTSSFNMRGKTQYEEITSDEKIKIIAEGNVFWKQPDNSLVRMNVELSSKSSNLFVSDRQKKH